MLKDFCPRSPVISTDVRAQSLVKTKKIMPDAFVAPGPAESTAQPHATSYRVLPRFHAAVFHSSTFSGAPCSAASHAHNAHSGAHRQPYSCHCSKKLRSSLFLHNHGPRLSGPRPARAAPHNPCRRLALAPTATCRLLLLARATRCAPRPACVGKLPCKDESDMGEMGDTVV